MVNTRMFHVVLSVLLKLASFLRPSELLSNRVENSSVWPGLEEDTSGYRFSKAACISFGFEEALPCSG